MTATIAKSQVLTDAAGFYTAYTYTDGHVETAPPNRPVSKEDLQRQIRDQLAQANATKALTNDRARYSKSQAQMLAPNAQQIARAEADVVAGGLVTKPLSDSIRDFTVFAATASAPEGHVDQLVSTVPLGGTLASGDAVEYASPAVVAASHAVVRANYAIESRPLELVRS